MRTMIFAAIAIGLLPTAAAQGAEARESGVRVMRGGDAGTSWERGPMRAAPMHMGSDDSSAFNDYPEYRPIGRGGVVPGYWANPRYGISDYRHYGFDRPSDGARWVRYYDDALLVDRSGRVRDGRYGMDFDRYGDGWDYDDRGIPFYTGTGTGRLEDRDYAWGERLEREEGGELAYDRDYPYEHRYGGAGRGEVSSGYGHEGYGQQGYSGGGYTITDTTVTTGPSTVHYLEDAVAVHKPKRYLKTKRAYRTARRGHQAKPLMRCAC